MQHHVHLSGCDDASGNHCKCSERRYQRIAGLTLVIAAVELIGSRISGSISILADTTHVGLDFFSALISVFVARRVRKHQGSHALQVGGMRVSGAFLLCGLALITYEAIGRLHNPQAVAGVSVMVATAIAGLLNVGQLWLVPRDHTPIAKSQYMHAFGDLLTSIVVFMAGAGVLLTGIKLIDPYASFVVVAIVGVLTIKMMLNPGQPHHGHSH